MESKEFYRGTKERVFVDDMKKSDLRFELENMRIEYDKLMLKQEICRMVDRMEAPQSLQKVRDYTESVYRDFASEWECLFGMRDDIVAMADNLADMLRADKLIYFAHFMYYKLVDEVDVNEALNGLSVVTDEMRKRANAKKEQLIKHKERIE